MFNRYSIALILIIYVFIYINVVQIFSFFWSFVNSKYPLFGKPDKSLPACTSLKYKIANNVVFPRKGKPH